MISATDISEFIEECLSDGTVCMVDKDCSRSVQEDITDCWLCYLKLWVIEEDHTKQSSAPWQQEGASAMELGKPTYQTCVAELQA